MEGRKRRSEGSEQTETRGPKEVGPHGQIPWPRGTPPSWASWIRCRPFSSPWLRLDLKPTIKKAPRGVSRRGGGQIQHQKQRDRRLLPKKIGGAKRRRNHFRRSSPSPLQSLHQHHCHLHHHLHHHLRDPLHPPHSLRLFDPYLLSKCYSTFL